MRQRSVILPRPRTSRFNLSHNYKFTCDMGQLIPFLCREVVPGDDFKGQSQFKIDFAPQIKPVIHNVDVFTYFFYVPNRIIWDAWKDFIVGGTEEAEAIIPPTIEFTNVAVSSLADYIGVPTGVANPLKVSALPFRAINFIWNEYFRNEDIQDEVIFSKASGVDTITSTDLLNICWEKDYFTTATKSQQYGDGVSLSFSGTAPIKATGDGAIGNAVVVDSSLGGRTTLRVPSGQNYVGLGNQQSEGAIANSLEADLSGVNPFSISLFRQAMILQNYYEKLNLSGHRYNEFIKTVFGETIPDSTLQKPEYLGGGRSPVVFSPVLQTSQSTDSSAQGNQSGYATAFHNSHKFSKHFNEHGWLIGLVVLRPQSGYMQGIDRQLTKETKLDYLVPDFVGLSEQPIYNKELFAQGTDADNLVFGHQERYSEYKQIENSSHGEFRTNLDCYHMDRKFSVLPTLSSEFVKCDPTTRIFAVEGTYVNHLRVVAGNYIIADRPVPKYSMPSGLSNKSVY